ncbi:MAG: hypothetical protein JF586_23705 [Burkholderiales bacterium]|nr:hypothetical protein [Burkholderiales bacterium]
MGFNAVAVDFVSYLELRSISPTGLLSWCFVLALATKLVTTAAGLRLRARSDAQAYIPSPLWWASKVSAIVLCAAAWLLCRMAGDKAGELAFLVLLMLACALVVALAFKRMGPGCRRCRTGRRCRP